MALRLCDEKKKSAATTDVENVLRRRAMEIEILHAPNVEAQIFFEIEILRIMPPTRRRISWRCAVFGSQRLQTIAVDLGEQGLHRDRMKDATNAPPRSPIS